MPSIPHREITAQEAIKPPTSAALLAEYRRLKLTRGTHPEAIQSAWMAYTAAVEAEMALKHEPKEAIP